MNDTYPSAVFTHIVVEPDPDMPINTRWTDPRAAAFLQEIFAENDPQTAAEQANERYAHGGGWNPTPGITWTLHEPQKTGGTTMTSQYPEDPPLREMSRTRLPLTKETLILFTYGYVACIADNGAFEVSRMD